MADFSGQSLPEPAGLFQWALISDGAALVSSDAAGGRTDIALCPSICCNHCFPAPQLAAVLLANSCRSELSHTEVEALTEHRGRIIDAEFGTGQHWLCCLLVPMQL